jgi:hypothetical protein
MWYEGLAANAGGPISYLYRTCGRRLHITAVFEEVPPGVEAHAAVKGAGDSVSHKPAAEAHAHVQHRH